MISEKQFANEFSGFWAETIPFLTPQVIAELNLGGAAMGAGRREWMKPLVGSGDNSINDVIAETAFGLFAKAIHADISVEELAKDTEIIMHIEESAKRRVLGFRREGIHGMRDTRTGRNESISLANRLEAYFKSYPPSSILIQPRFRGCGILDSCYGDILGKKCLFELKMVDRNLRSADLRQLLTYCALNYHSSQYQIESLALLNPRRGVEFAFLVEDLAERASRKNASELFHQITSFLSGFDRVHLPS